MATPDPTKTPKEQLIESINRLYNLNLTSASVRFGVPELINSVVSDISDPTARNSRVVVSNAAEEPYEFTTVAHFNRLSLESLFDERDTSFAGEIIHTYDLVPLIGSRLGLNLSTDDIVGHSIDTSAGYPLNVLVVASVSSLILFGQINVTLTGP